jgi:hypothetical protein
MNFQEALAGAISHYEKKEIGESMALGLIALGAWLLETYYDVDEEDAPFPPWECEWGQEPPDFL